MRTVVKPSSPKFEEAVVVDSKPGKDQKDTDAKIALIYLRGVITAAEPGTLGETMVDDIKIQLEQAATDDKVKAVVLYVDSPGGEVTASDSIYNAVRKLSDGGIGTKKPDVVYMGSLAASGGYYVSCAGNWLMANETTLTGSIGVIMQSLNYRQLFGKVGLETITFKSGQFKDMLSGSRELTQDERDLGIGVLLILARFAVHDHSLFKFGGARLHNRAHAIAAADDEDDAKNEKEAEAKAEACQHPKTT
jgi:protease-4